MERDGYVRLPRVSDVLALCQYNDVSHHSYHLLLELMPRFQDITLIGMRNGVVDRWDSREPGGKTDLVVNMADCPSPWKMTPSIDYLRMVHGHELLVRTMRGDVRILHLHPVCSELPTFIYAQLEMHDLRFLRRNTPLLQFSGFSPSFDSKLASSPLDMFLY